MLRWRLSPYWARVTVHRRLVFTLVILGAVAGWLTSVAAPESFTTRDSRVPVATHPSGHRDTTISDLRTRLDCLRPGMSASEVSRFVALKDMKLETFCNHHWAYHSVTATGYSLSLQFTDHGFASAQLRETLGLVEVWPK
jgi:hypothetical protein